MQGPPRKPESEVEWVVDAIFLASSEAKHFSFLEFFHHDSSCFLHASSDVTP